VKKTIQDEPAKKPANTFIETFEVGDTFTIQDDAYSSGAAGIYTFARGNKVAYFDDISVAPITAKP